jgi:DNA-directed RNA polymerase specialized sigma24 family protein
MRQGGEIIPIVVIPPFPEVFRKYMDHTMLEKTLEVLEGLSEKYKQLIVLNYLDDSDFDEYYFSDWYHLNYWRSNR